VLQRELERFRRNPFFSFGPSGQGLSAGEYLQGTERTRPGRYFMPDVDIDIHEYRDRPKLWADTGTVAATMYDQLAPEYTGYNVGAY
jgi:hypothetical protein